MEAEKGWNHIWRGDLILQKIKPPSWRQRFRWRIVNAIEAIVIWYLDVVYRLPFERSPIKYFVGMIIGRKRDFNVNDDCQFFQSRIPRIRLRSSYVCDGDGNKACNVCRHHNKKSNY